MTATQRSLTLGVEVRELAALEQRVIRRVDARNHVRSAEGNLFRLREVLVDVTVESQGADLLDRDELLGPDLRRIEQVELELVLVGLRNRLDAKLPLREGTRVNGVVEVTPVEVGVLAVELEGLIPNERVDAEFGAEVELDEVTLASLVGEDEGVNWRGRGRQGGG